MVAPKRRVVGHPLTDGDRYLLASRALLVTGSDKEALTALDKAITADHSIQHDPNTQIQRGLLAARQGQPDRALEYFTEAKQVAAPSWGAAYVVDLWSAVLLRQKGDRNSATQILGKSDVQRRVANNPSLLPFTESQLCYGKAAGCPEELHSELKTLVD